jgi:hypothetical protein
MKTVPAIVDSDLERPALALLQVAERQINDAALRDGIKSRAAFCAFVVISGGIALCFLLMEWMHCAV